MPVDVRLQSPKNHFSPINRLITVSHHMKVYLPIFWVVHSIQATMKRVWAARLRVANSSTYLNTDVNKIAAFTNSRPGNPQQLTQDSSQRLRSSCEGLRISAFRCFNSLLAIVTGLLQSTVSNLVTLPLDLEFSDSPSDFFPPKSN